jgi:tetratricopeptide (TPR) repeat protein
MLSRIIALLSLSGLLSIGAAERPALPRSFEIPGPWNQFRSLSKINNGGLGIPDGHRKTVAPAWSPGAVEAESALAVTPLSQERSRRTDASYRRRKIEEWRTAVAEHRPGKPDSAAVTIGGWDEGDLELPVDFLTKLASRSLSARRTLARASTRRILQLTDREAQHGDLNRILKRGALLHTDIARLELEKRQPPFFGEQIGIFADGRVAMQPKMIHWKYARRLLESISPFPDGISSRAPFRDPAVRQWYIATTAHMLSRRLLAYAGQNIGRALEIFPSDARILFYAGVLHETWASPSNQNILLPPDGEVSYGSKESELKKAQQYFRKALAQDPDFFEARLRLGRVLGRLGLHYQAVAELQLAAAAIKDPQLSYYNALFLGREFSMLELYGKARDQYRRAAMLYPSAQSPLFALSHLEHGSDDAEGALLALQRVFSLTVRDPWKDDPWWEYDLAPVRDAPVLMAEMQQMLGGNPQ